MPVSKEKKPVTLGETIQLVLLAGVLIYVFITSPQMFRATAEVFYHNVFEFLWNSIFLYLCLRAIFLLWIRPLFRKIFTDTSKLGQKLEWYDRSYEQLTPETKPLAIKRYGILFTLAALSMLIPYLPFSEARRWFPSFSMLLSEDAHTAYFKSYLAPLTNFESFAVFSFIFWVFIAFEGRSRILARLLVMLETKKKNNEFTKPLPQNPFNPKSNELDIAIFSKQGAEGQQEEWCLMREEDLRGNALIFSPIGGGKTQGIIKPFIEQVVAWQADNQEKKASIIIYDPKAELTEFTVDLAYKIGRGDDLLVLSFDSPGVTINPLYTKNPWASQSASQMGGAIILAWINFQGKEPHDPYWVNQTYLLISHIIVYLYCDKGTNLTLYQVYDMWLAITSGLSIKKSGRINALGLQILSYLYASDQEKFEQCFDKFTFEVDPKVPHSNELNSEKDALIESLLREFENERVSYHASSNEDLKNLVQTVSEIPEAQLDENHPILRKLEEQIAELVSEDVKNEFSYNEYELDVRAYTKIQGLELQKELKEAYGQDNDIEDVYHLIKESMYWFINSWHEFASSENAQSIMSNIQPFLKEFTSPAMVRMFSPEKQTVNFHDLVDKGSIIIPSFPGMEVGDKLANAIVTLVKSSWQNAVLANGDTKRTKVQVIDEGQRVLTISESGSGSDLEYYEVSRSFGGCTFIVSQSMAALSVKASGGVAFEKIFGVVRTVGTLGTIDSKTIDFIQKIASKHIAKRKSRTVSESKSGTKMDPISEEYGSDNASLSISYTESESLEDRVQALDITEADPFTGFFSIYSSKKSSLSKVFLKPYYWPDRRDSHKLMMKSDFSPARRKKFKRKMLSDPIKKLYEKNSKQTESAELKPITNQRVGIK